ncbi:MAG: hypothetical protein ACREJ2_04325, partial [Planctomycetota bacterium]
MELIELLIVIFEALFVNKNRNAQARARGTRRHEFDPGADLEGARPKIDRYGLDHAVPVVVFDVGPDSTVQPARVRAGQKRRQIEERLVQEARAREAQPAGRAPQTAAPMAPARRAAPVNA